MTAFTADFFRRAQSEWARFKSELGRAPDRTDDGIFIDWLRDHMDLSEHWTAYLRFHRVEGGLHSALAWRESEDARRAARAARAA